MSSAGPGSVFSSLFLERIDDPDVNDPLTEDGIGEAETAGPWTVRQRPDQQWEIVTEGRDPAAVVPSYEMALLIAAALPALGRRFFQIVRAGEGAGSGARVLLNAREEEIGTLAAVHEEPLAAYLNILEFLRRSPLDLARVMYAARGPALRRAGAILWIWEQAAR